MNLICVSIPGCVCEASYEGRLLGAGGGGGEERGVCAFCQRIGEGRLLSFDDVLLPTHWNRACVLDVAFRPRICSRTSMASRALARGPGCKLVLTGTLFVTHDRVRFHKDKQSTREEKAKNTFVTGDHTPQ
jgi:hypothetical protein